MSKKLDLNAYLSKYANNNNTSNDNRKKSVDNSKQSQQNFRPSQRIAQSNFSTFNDQVAYEEFPHKTSTNYSTGFQKAQRECLEQLQEIKKGLIEEEQQMTYFMENYYKKLHEKMLSQHIKIKQQLLDLFQRSFEQNQRRIQQIIKDQGGNQPIQFINIRKKVNQINIKIQKLEQGLRSDNYKASIAQVVTSDFETEINNIQVTINNAQKAYLDNNVNLNLDQIRYNRIREDLQNLIVLDQFKKQSLEQSQQKKLARSKPPLFENLRSTHQNRDIIQGNSNFFNFNS